MELMATCLDKLMKKLDAALPERILGKVAVAVSVVILSTTELKRIFQFVSHAPQSFLCAVLQTVKALSYLKEEHGVIHRGENF